MHTYMQICIPERSLLHGVLDEHRSIPRRAPTLRISHFRHHVADIKVKRASVVACKVCDQRVTNSIYERVTNSTDWTSHKR